MIVDEREVAKQKYINVLVGSLETPINTNLIEIECRPPETCSSVNSDFILHTADDILRQLEIKRENFALLFTDAVCYSSLPDKTLKEFIPFFDACHPHGTITI